MIKKIKEIFEKSQDQPIELDDRYISKKKMNPRGKQEQLMRHWIEENKKAIAILRKNKHALSLEPFYKLFESEKLCQAISAMKASGHKIVGTMCNLVPEELIIAAGARPLRLCSGCNQSIRAGEEVYPRDSCPLVKSILGFAVENEPLFSLCDVVAIPATCDAKKKLGEVLNGYKEVWMLDLPQSKERDISKNYWLSETRVFQARLEKLTGNKITRDSLSRSIKLLYRRNDAIRDLLDIQKGKPKILGSDFLIVIQASFYLEPEKWCELAEKLVRELKQMNPIMKDTARILVTGSPMILPNFKVPLAIEGHNAIIAADVTCAGSQYAYDPVRAEEGSLSELLRAVSERYLLPSVCPCFVKSDDRIDKILNTIREHRIDAVVYHTLRLCLPFDVESRKISDVLQAEGVPFLSINTDYSKEDLGQLGTRVEAFLEMIDARKNI